MSRLRGFARFVKSTPLHPQWLLPARRVPPALRDVAGRILDIGAADRWLRPRLGPQAEYIALDYPTTALGLYGTRPDVFADACQMPFASASFDAIACFEVLEHVSSPDAVLREIARMLKSGGAAFFSMPFLYPVHDAPHDYQRWTEFGWRRSAKAAGLHFESIDAALHPIRTAGALACLALAGPLQSARPLGLIARLPVAAIMIPLINLSAWVLAAVWPAWPAMTIGNRVTLRKV